MDELSGVWGHGNAGAAWVQLRVGVAATKGHSGLADLLPSANFERNGVMKDSSSVSLLTRAWVEPKWTSLPPV